MKSSRVKFSIRFPERLLAEVDKAAESMRTSRSAFLEVAVRILIGESMRRGGFIVPTAHARCRFR